MSREEYSNLSVTNPDDVGARDPGHNVRPPSPDLYIRSVHKDRFAVGESGSELNNRGCVVGLSRRPEELV
jgi:hypothetical protein